MRQAGQNPGFENEYRRRNSKVPDRRIQAGPGGCDLIPTYQKLSNAGERTYCILDDPGARRKAAKMGIGFTGLIGLLQMIKRRNLMSHDEIDEIARKLKNSNFRYPADVSI